MISAVRRSRIWRRIGIILTINIVVTIVVLFRWHGRNIVQSQDVMTRLTSRQMLFKPPFVYRSPVSPAAGKPFNVSLEIVESLHLIPGSFTTLTAANADNVVIVTAASSNHFIESKNMIASVQKFKPGRLIIYYDLGLEPEQANEVRSWCSVTLRKFGHPAYPKHVTGKLGCYAFKLLIIQEILREFPGMFWMDASIRLLGSNFSAAYDKAVENDGFVIINNGLNNIFTVTHPDLYEYMPSNIERLKRTWIRASGLMLIYNTYETFKKYLLWMYLCALDVKCAAPRTTLGCHYNEKNRWRTWAKCHRYDQSIVNVLAANRWNFDSDAYHVQGFPFKVLKIKHMRLFVDPVKCDNIIRRKTRKVGR